MSAFRKCVLEFLRGNLSWRSAFLTNKNVLSTISSKMMAKTETLQSETKTRSHECFRFKKRYGEVRRGLWGDSVGGSGAEGNDVKENIFFNRAERFGCVVGEIRGDSGRRGKGGGTLAMRCSDTLGLW